MSRDSKSKGIGIFGVVQIVFIVLKLTNLIDWSWKYVLLPIEIEVILFILIWIYFFIKQLLEKIFGW